MPTWDPELLDKLEALPAAESWTGRVWRHMFNDYRPERVNTSGARWNPAGCGAVYTAMDEATARAEGQHAVDVQPRRTFARRVLYEVEVEVERVVDLTVDGVLADLGLTPQMLISDDFSDCQRIGGALAWLERGGLIVPSARAEGANLVILVTSHHEPEIVEVSAQVLEDRTLT